MSALPLSIHLNGEPRAIEADQTIEALVASFPISPKMILVEINNEALLRSEWTTRKIQSGDRIEMIRVVAGG